MAVKQSPRRRPRFESSSSIPGPGVPVKVANGNVNENDFALAAAGELYAAARAAYPDWGIYNLTEPIDPAAAPGSERSIHAAKRQCG